MIVPLKVEHLETLRAMGALSYLSGVSLEQFKVLEQQAFAYTVLGKSNEVYACCGIIEFWPGRAEAWAFLATNLGAKMIVVHRAVKKFFREGHGVKRIEANVDTSSLNAHRWVKALGFELECFRMVAYHPDGTDASRYVLIR